MEEKKQPKATKSEKSLQEINTELNEFLRKNNVKIEPMFVKGEVFGEITLKVRLEVQRIK